MSHTATTIVIIRGTSAGTTDTNTTIHLYIYHQLHFQLYYY